MTDCAAVKAGIVKRKSKASLEFFYCGRPHYYCYGYIDRMTGCPLEVCRECNSNVRFAQGDMDMLMEG